MVVLVFIWKDLGFVLPYMNLNMLPAQPSNLMNLHLAGPEPAGGALSASGIRVFVPANSI